MHVVWLHVELQCMWHGYTAVWCNITVYSVFYPEILSILPSIPSQSCSVTLSGVRTTSSQALLITRVGKHLTTHSPQPKQFHPHSDQAGITHAPVLGLGTCSCADCGVTNELLACILHNSHVLFVYTLWQCQTTRGGGGVPWTSTVPLIKDTLY